MDHSIATIIHYCTNDYRFLKKVVEEVRPFSKKIIIPVCDHFFNGEKEDRALLQQNYRDFPDCEFIEFAYYPDKLYSPYLKGYTSKDREWAPFWHSTSRYIGALYLPPEIDYILFLDADEIPEGSPFARWLDRKEYQNYSAIRFYSFLYFQKPTFRARAFFYSGLLVKRKEMEINHLMNVEERSGLFAKMPDPKIGDFLDERQMPFFHHYSWARTKGECLQKSKTWGHRTDRNWEKEIDTLFTNPAAVDMLTEKVSYEEIPKPYFDPLAVEIPATKESGPAPSVLKVDLAAVRRKEIEQLLL